MLRWLARLTLAKKAWDWYTSRKNKDNYRLGD
jgi:hypothetical protein